MFEQTSVKLTWSCSALFQRRMTNRLKVGWLIGIILRFLPNVARSSWVYSFSDRSKSNSATDARADLLIIILTAIVVLETAGKSLLTLFGGRFDIK